VSSLYERLAAAVSLTSDDAAIRIKATYEPQGGPGSKVFPPTYIGDAAGTRYHFEKRWGADGDAVDVVVLDSIQSQANRAESALLEAVDELGLPQIVMEAKVGEGVVRVSSLQAPHRSRDAYFLDSEVDGVPFDKTHVGMALGKADAQDATAYLRHAPYDLVYGVWDSHRGKRMALKFARAYTSEILGWDLQIGKKAATKGDPFNVPGQSKVPLTEWRPEMQTANRKNTEQKLTELGYGMIPVAPDESTGGVSVRAITRTAVLSLSGLARYRFPVSEREATVPGRVTLAVLALLADRLAFGRAGLHLRSGSDLVLVSDHVEWVQRGATTESLDLNVVSAKELLEEARERLIGTGVTWESKPFVVQASDRLRQVIEQTLYVPELESVE
jgi:CRISPR-associated protein Csb1